MSTAIVNDCDDLLRYLDLDDMRRYSNSQYCQAVCCLRRNRKELGLSSDALLAYADVSSVFEYGKCSQENVPAECLKGFLDQKYIGLSGCLFDDITANKRAADLTTRRLRLPTLSLPGGGPVKLATIEEASSSTKKRQCSPSFQLLPPDEKRRKKIDFAANNSLNSHGSEVLYSFDLCQTTTRVTNIVLTKNAKGSLLFGLRDERVNSSGNFVKTDNDFAFEYANYSAFITSLAPVSAGNHLAITLSSQGGHSVKFVSISSVYFFKAYAVNSKCVLRSSIGLSAQHLRTMKTCWPAMEKVYGLHRR